ncbi:FtsW/RodA/SpoVE family cell cycle protein [bacterium]|nr:FtsW/RodA/SpoVE family cell cycle protein [candidate division CSSED10-310 bacterium]
MLETNDCGIPFRARERSLLLWTIPALLPLMVAALGFHPSGAFPPVRSFFVPAGCLLASLVGHGILVLARSRSDTTLLPAWAVIVGIGWSFQYRLDPSFHWDYLSKSTLAWVLSPLILVINAILFRGSMQRWIQRMHWFWIIASFGVCLAVLATGVSYRGAVFGPGKTTPTEWIKPFLILGLSGLLCRYGSAMARGRSLRTESSRRAHIMIIGAWLPTAAILILLKDLGMIAATGILLVALLTITTGRIRYLVTGLVCAVAGGWFFQHFAGKGRVRFAAWLHPFDHPDAGGFQTIRSLFALFNGEFFGQGIGNGFPGTVPLVETDFVYAGFAEEVGWFGSVLFLLLAWHFVQQGFHHANRANGIYAALVAMGASTVWAVQLFLHVGGVIKLIPMTGVPFPGLSSGGTAVLVFATLAGWISAVGDSGTDAPAEPRQDPVKRRNQRT